MEGVVRIKNILSNAIYKELDLWREFMVEVCKWPREVSENERDENSLD
jgi:hypothetical protein